MRKDKIMLKRLEIRFVCLIIITDKRKDSKVDEQGRNIGSYCTVKEYKFRHRHFSLSYGSLCPTLHPNTNRVNDSTVCQVDQVEDRSDQPHLGQRGGQGDREGENWQHLLFL